MRLGKLVIATLVAALACAGLLLGAATPGHALTDRWASWGPITGTANDYRLTMQQQAPGFPSATVQTDSRSSIQVASGASTYLGPGTPPGLKYGSSRNAPYLVLRPKADTPTTPSRTTYTFDHPTPQIGWAFVLGDIDSDQVQVAATDEDGDPVPAARIDTWFKGPFNYAGGTDLPTWTAGTSTLVGNAGATDTDGASGWFEPDLRLTSLTLTFTRRAGFPVYQTWFVSRARPVAGTVDDVSATGTCPVQDTRLTLLSPYGEEVATTQPRTDGGYTFPDVATQSGYVVRMTPPPSCAAVGATQEGVSNVGNDGDPASLADFRVRAIIPQPISGRVTDSAQQPVAGATVTLHRPVGGDVTTTTATDGSYLFDDNPAATGYSVTLTVPDGYVATSPTTIGGITVQAVPITGRDFTVRALPAVSGQVVGGGDPLGGVQVTLTPTAGGPAVTTVTDGDGRYAFPGLAGATYTISVTPPAGFSAAPARTVTVTTTDVPGQDFTLDRPGAVGGQVIRAEDGSPVAGVPVLITGPAGGTATTTTTPTDGDGSYFVDGLAPGDYTVSVTPPAGLQVVAPTTLALTITAAGEIRGGRDFVLTAPATASATPTPTASPSHTPTPGPSHSPSHSPTVSTSVTPTSTSTIGPTTGTTGGGGLPNTGGPSVLWLWLGGALVAAGALLLGVRVLVKQ